MVKNLLLDILGDFPGWLALLIELMRRGKSPAAAAQMAASQGAATAQPAPQRLPNTFGIGRTDEQLFEAIRQLMDVIKRGLVDLVVGKMRDYEVEIFRLTIAGMPCGGETIDDPVRNPQRGQPATVKKSISWEFTRDDLRVKYLGDIADEVSLKIASGLDEQTAAKKVVADMRARRLITRSPAAQKTYEIWADATKFVKTEILDLFGVKLLKDITPDMVAQQLETLALQIPDRHGGEVSPGFWATTCRHHPVQALFLAGGTIAVVVAFLAIALIN